MGKVTDLFKRLVLRAKERLTDLLKWPPLRKPVNYYIFLISLIFLVTLIFLRGREHLLINQILLALYFLTALAGLWVYRVQGHPLYLLTQIGFFFSVGWLLLFGALTGIDTDSYPLGVYGHTVLFFASYGFLMFFWIFALLHSSTSIKIKQIIFGVVVSLLWISLEVYFYQDSTDIEQVCYIFVYKI